MPGLTPPAPPLTASLLCSWPSSRNSPQNRRRRAAGRLEGPRVASAFNSIFQKENFQLQLILPGDRGLKSFLSLEPRDRPARGGVTWRTRAPSRRDSGLLMLCCSLGTRLIVLFIKQMNNDVPPSSHLRICFCLLHSPPRVENRQSSVGSSLSVATPALFLLLVSMGCRCLLRQRDSGRWAAASRKPALEGARPGAGTSCPMACVEARLECYICRPQ